MVSWRWTVWSLSDIQTQTNLTMDSLVLTHIIDKSKGVPGMCRPLWIQFFFIFMHPRSVTAQTKHKLLPRKTQNAETFSLHFVRPLDYGKESEEDPFLWIRNSYLNHLFLGKNEMWTMKFDHFLYHLSQKSSKTFHYSDSMYIFYYNNPLNSFTNKHTTSLPSGLASLT